MAKPAKTPTIQDLSRDELLRLIPMVTPFGISPRAILRVQWDVACEKWRPLSDALVAASEAAAAAARRWQEARKSGVYRDMERAHSEYTAASAAVASAAKQEDRALKRCDRLYDQLCALDKEG